MNVDIGTEAGQFLVKEQINGIFVAVCFVHAMATCPDKRFLYFHEDNFFNEHLLVFRAGISAFKTFFGTDM